MQAEIVQIRKQSVHAIEAVKAGAKERELQIHTVAKELWMRSLTAKSHTPAGIGEANFFWPVPDGPDAQPASLKIAEQENQVADR